MIPGGDAASSVPEKMRKNESNDSKAPLMNKDIQRLLFSFEKKDIADALKKTHGKLTLSRDLSAIISSLSIKTAFFCG